MNITNRYKELDIERWNTTNGIRWIWERYWGSNSQ